MNSIIFKSILLNVIFVSSFTLVGCGGGGNSATPRTTDDGTDIDKGNPDTAANSEKCTATESWESIPNGPLAGRDQMATFWTGSEYLMYGGVLWGATGPGNYYDGARYNPTTKVWTSIPAASMLSSNRWDVSYAYGDGRLLAWGGNTNDTPANKGAVYDLKTNTWEATSTVNAPVARAYHVAVFANSKFYVWGGRSNQSPVALNSGGIYDPVNDTWVAMRTTNAPAGTSYFAYAQSDQKLFVFGGSSDVSPWMESVSAVTNAGGVYDFASNRWTGMSTVNAPSARRNASGVWTGSKFIVFGGIGLDRSQYYNSGGIYDPATDSWTSMSTVNAPIGRMLHYAVWLGDRMLVFGGFNGAALNDGALFDPVANKWSPMTKVGVPSPRYLTTTGYQIWNGKSLLVYSGFKDSGIHINDGALYTPSCLGAAEAAKNPSSASQESRTSSQYFEQVLFPELKKTTSTGCAVGGCHLVNLASQNIQGFFQVDPLSVSNSYNWAKVRRGSVQTSSYSTAASKTLRQQAEASHNAFGTWTAAMKNYFTIWEGLSQ